MGEQPELIQQAFRFALAPTAEQEVFLGSCCGAARFWFNQGLALVKERLGQRAAGEDVDLPWSYKSLCVAFRGDAIKDELAPWRSEVVVGSYQAGLEALGNALQKFRKARKAGRRAGFPRYRAKGPSHEAVIFQRPRLLARDPHARILRSTVQRANGGWVIAFAVERSRKERRARRPHAAVGVDLGLTRLATLSTGQAAVNSRPLQQALRALRRLQRRLDRQRRASNPGNYPARRARQARRRNVGEVAADAGDRAPDREAPRARGEPAP